MKLNGETIETPAKIEWSLQDLSSDSSGRTIDDGTMHKDRLAQKRKLTCTWPPMSWAQAALLLQKVSTNTFFAITYPDMLSGQEETRTFYVGDRKASTLFCKDGDQWVNGIAFDFIER